MAETVDTQPIQPVETEVPAECTGTAFLSVLHGGDTYGHSAAIDWCGEHVTISRKSSGRGERVTTTERDHVTEGALLAMTVPGARPPNDFSLMINADDCSGCWPGFLHLRVRQGKAEIVERSGRSWPAAIPAWFLSALRDLVLVEREEDDD